MPIIVQPIFVDMQQQKLEAYPRIISALEDFQHGQNILSEISVFNQLKQPQFKEEKDETHSFLYCFFSVFLLESCSYQSTSNHRIVLFLGWKIVSSLQMVRIFFLISILKGL